MHSSTYSSVGIELRTEVVGVRFTILTGEILYTIRAEAESYIIGHSELRSLW